MRQVLSILVFLLASTAAFADGPPVNNANFLIWDHDAESASVTTEYRVYCQRNAGVTGDPVLLIATVAVPVQQWAISNLPPGQQHCVVSAFSASGNIESDISNEVPFVVYGRPNNLRVQDDDTE